MVTQVERFRAMAHAHNRTRRIPGVRRFRAAMVALCLAACGAYAADAGPLPAISHVVESVEQGGTLTLFGDGMDDETRVWLWQPSPNAGEVLKSPAALEELRQMAERWPEAPALPATPPQGARVAQRLGSAGDRRVVMVRQAGSAHPAWDDSHVLPTLLWLERAGSFSAPYLVNGPQIWFASEHTTVPGERLRLFGINLLGGHHGPSRALIALRRTDSGAVYWGRQLRRYNQEHANVRQHEISFRLPEELSEGDYEVRVHPLAGGPYGWSHPIRCRVVARRDWLAHMAREDDSRLGTPGGDRFPAAPPVFRVTGAAGDGIADDGPAIRRAGRVHVLLWIGRGKRGGGQRGQRGGCQLDLGLRGGARRRCRAAGVQHLRQ